MLFKGVRETIQNEAKEPKRGFLSMLLDASDASLLGHMLTGKGIIRAGYGSEEHQSEKKRNCKSRLWIQEVFNKEFLILPHSLTNFEIQKYYQNQHRFNGVYSREDIPDKIKHGSYVINFNEYSSFRTHWIPLYALNNNATYFDSLGIEHFPKEIKKFIKRFAIVTNVFRIQSYDSVMCEYFCIGFIDFMLTGKSLTDFTNLFSPNYLRKNDDIILNYFLNG